MKMSRLQKKTIKIAMSIMAVICVVSLVFFALFIYHPLRENAINISITALESLVTQANDVCKSIREFTDYVAYGNNLSELVNDYAEYPAEDTKYEISSWLNQMRNLHTGVYVVALEVEGRQIYGLTGVDAVEEELLSSPWYQRMRDKSYGYSYSIGLRTADGNERMIAYARKYNIRNHDVIITVFMDPTEWFGGIDRGLKQEFDSFIWAYDNQVVLYPDEAGKTWLRDVELSSLQFGANELAGGGVLLMSSVTDAGYTIIAYVAHSTLLGMFSRYILLIAAMLLLLLMSMTTAMLYISGKVSRPVTELSHEMERIIDNGFKSRLKVDSDDEIGSMQSAFNLMSNQISGYMQERTQNAVREQQMKFGLLISQVDPHFFCNTLNTINYLARMGKTGDVAVASTALSNILRDRLRLKDFKVFDTVQQELEIVDQYMRIQSYRYGDRVKLRVHCPDALLECNIPKNIIQPLVENSIFHGLADEEEGSIAGEIAICISGTAEQIAISVTDDGVGISEEMIARIQNRIDGQNYTLIEKGHGIGLFGVLERLDILFKENYSYVVERIQPHGTRVVIRMRMDCVDTDQFTWEVRHDEDHTDCH